MYKKSFVEQEGNKSNYCVLLHAVSTENYVSRRHYHEAVEIGFIVNGKNGFCVNDEMQYLTSGQISYIKGWDIHYFDIFKDVETYTLVLGKDYLRDFCNVYGSKEQIPCFERSLTDVEANKKLFEIVRTWWKDYDPKDRLKNQGYIDLLLSEMAKAYKVNLLQDSREQMDALNSILEYIGEHYREQITLAQVAGYVGYAKNYCSQLFHRYIKQDFRNYINGVRVEECQRMMDEAPNRRIVDIALACGFNSLNSFYRAYRRVYNANPKR